MWSTTPVTSMPHTAAVARSSCVSTPPTSATHSGTQPVPSRRSSSRSCPGGARAGAAASARHHQPPRPDRRTPPGCIDRGVLAGACVSIPGPVGAAPVRGRSRSSAGLHANRERLWPQRRRPRPPHGAPGRGERGRGARSASLNSPATAAAHSRPADRPRPSRASHRHGGGAGSSGLDRWWRPTRPRRHVPITSSSSPRPSQRRLPSHDTLPKRSANVQGEGRWDGSKRPGTVDQAGLAARKKARGRLSPRKAHRRDRPRAKNAYEQAKNPSVKKSRTPPLSTKVILILEERRYRYQAAISDLAGSDIEAHRGNYRTAVRKVRNWLAGLRGFGNAVGAARILAEYEDFQEWYYERQLEAGFSHKDIQDYSTAELLEAMFKWSDQGRPRK